MSLPGFNAEATLYSASNPYKLATAWIDTVDQRITPAQVKGCTPCFNGQKRCCFGFDPDTGPICETRPCTSPPPPTPTCCPRGCVTC